MHFVETKNWFGEWGKERDFDSYDRAKQWATEQFPQTGWRVCKNTNQPGIGIRVIYEFDPMVVMTDVATQELDRFTGTDRWCQRFADRREQQELEQSRQQARHHREGIMRARRQLAHDRQSMRLMLGEETMGKVNWLKEGF